MTAKRLRAGLYERVSTGTTNTPDSRSLRRQNKASADAVERNGWILAGRYPDPGISASRYARNPERPEWNRLLQDIRGKKLDVVVLWEPSRGDRKLSGWAAFLDACRETGTRIFITNNNHLYDPARDYEDYSTLANAGVDSAKESDKTSSRTKDGIALSAAEGDPHGKVPYGYTRRYELIPGDRHHKIIQEPHKTEAPVVAEILTRLSQYEPITTIANDLERRKVPSSTGNGRWHQKSIKRLALLGYCYIGKRMYNGSLLPGNWPPIVDEDIFWRAHNILKGRTGKAPGKTTYLLSYLAECECGAKLSPRTSGFPEPIYRCVKGHTSAPVKWLDALVTYAVVRYTARPLMYAILTRSDDKEAQAARDEAEAQRQRLVEYDEMAIAGDILPESYARISKGIKARIAELEQEAHRLAAPPVLRDLLGDPQPNEKRREEEMFGRWRGMTIQVQREVIAAISSPVLRRASTKRLDPHRVSMNFKLGEPE